MARTGGPTFVHQKPNGAKPTEQAGSKSRAAPGPPILFLTLPWPPTVNHYWMRTRRGFAITPEGRQYRESVAWTVKNTLTGPFADSVSVVIRAHPPDRRRRDLDNILKALLDALEHAGVYDDDSQIDHLEIQRCRIKPDGSVDVAVMAEKELE